MLHGNKKHNVKIKGTRSTPLADAPTPFHAFYMNILSYRFFSGLHFTKKLKRSTKSLISRIMNVLNAIFNLVGFLLLLILKHCDGGQLNECKHQMRLKYSGNVFVCIFSQNKAVLKEAKLLKATAAQAFWFSFLFVLLKLGHKTKVFVSKEC